MHMHMINKQDEKNNVLTDHTLIIHELERSIKFYNWDFILSFLPKGSFLVGGYIRDIILGRMSAEVDVDIVVPSNAIDVGKKISRNFQSRFVILDEKREVIRLIFSHISIDISTQITPSILEDLKSRDFSINAVAFSLDKNLLIDPLNGIKDMQISLIRTYSTQNLLDDPLRMIRCFRFVSELHFNIDPELINFIQQNKRQINFVAKERISYEIHRIICGENALKSIILIKKLNIFNLKNSYNESFFIDLKKIDYEVLNRGEKKQFLPLFFLTQILDEESLKKFQFSKSEIVSTQLLRKWQLIIIKKDIFQLSELERFDLQKQLENIFPSFIFYLPQKVQVNWLKRWRDKDDKLFHPSHLINGNLIKQHCDVPDGPILGKVLNYLSKEYAYNRLNNFDEAIYKAKQWFEQNAPKCD